MDPCILLGKLLQSSNLPHALLFSGSDLRLKKEAAIRFTQHLFHQDGEDFGGFTRCIYNCKSCALILSKTHPDFLHIDEAPISIDRIRELRRRFETTPFLVPWKIAVLDDSETMTLEAANAFLKVLEEPRGNALFILLAKSRSSILPTIASRTMEVRFPMRDIKKSFHVSSYHGEAIRIFENGLLTEKFNTVKKYSLKNKEELLTLLDAWLMDLREKLFLRKEKAQLLKKILSLKQVISATNANPQLLLEELFLNYA